MKFYVAYGSNLNIEQMKRRCPDASIICKGLVEDYALKYRGSKTGAYATIIREEGKSVPVVVWKISPRDEKNLDIYEGFPNFYYKKRVTVSLENGKSMYGIAYIMFDKARPGLPSPHYMETILDGYIANGLPVGTLIESLKDNEEEMI